MSGGIDDHDPLDARQAVAALDDLVTQPGFAEASLPQIDGRELFARTRFGAVRGVELPDGTTPVDARWRLTRDQWSVYLACCAIAPTTDKEGLH